MRGIFWSIAMAIGVGGAFLSGIVLPNDREGAPPNRSLVEGPAYPEPPGWSCDGSNWIFFDRECSHHRRHRHHHRPAIAVDGNVSVEARREPGSDLESSPAPIKSARISPNDESATRPEIKADARRIRREHGRVSQPRTARGGEPLRIPPDLYGYYAYAPFRGTRWNPVRRGRIAARTLIQALHQWRSLPDLGTSRQEPAAATP